MENGLRTDPYGLLAIKWHQIGEAKPLKTTGGGTFAPDEA